MIGDLFVLICWLIVGSFLFIFGAIVLLVILMLLKEKVINVFGSELKNTDTRVRKAYVMKLDDEELLKKVALNDSDKDVAIWAVERIKTKSSLEEISQSDRGIVSRVARRKMDNL